MAQGASPAGVAAVVHGPVEIKQPRIREVRGERQAHRIKGVRRARLSDSGHGRRKAIERGGADEGKDEGIEAVIPVDDAECTPTFTPTVM